MTNNVQNIEITIPEKTVEAEYLFKILGLCSNTQKVSPALIRATSNPELLPTTSLAIKPTDSPAISFQGEGLGNDRYFVGKLPIGFNLGKVETASFRTSKPNITVKTDGVGEYLKVEWSFATYNQLTLKQLYERIEGKVASLDHIGVNINSNLLLPYKFHRLKQEISRSSCLNSYPHEKEWSFILPASDKEQGDEVALGIERDPKFEFVYNFKYRYPEIQFDIQMDISPKEVLALFPKPSGYYDPDPVNGDYCSSVYIYTGWNNVSLRFDLRFYIPNFSSSDWLIENGERIS